MASGFFDIRFPEDISWGAVGGPGYNTGIVKTISGGEQRIQNWAQARCTYQVAQGVKSQEQLDALIAFFRVCKGKTYGFRYKDWADYTAVKQYVCTGDDTTTIFQLQKIYTNSTYYTVRTITKPVANTVTFYIDGVLCTTAQTANITLDYSTGVITLASATGTNGKILSASFEFDVPVRFDTDEMPVSIDDWQTYSWNGITLIEMHKGGMYSNVLF